MLRTFAASRLLSNARLRLKLEESHNLVGACSIRGVRKQNEDRFYRGIVNLGHTNAIYCAVFDGHGGQAVSEYLSAKLHGLVETHSEANSLEPEKDESYVKAIEKRKVLTEKVLKSAVLGAEEEMLKTLSQDSVAGSTASVAVVQPLPVFENVSAGELLTIAHVGDCRILLCSNLDGKAIQLTPDHRPSVREEKERIIGQGGNISLDSFGQMAVMGMLACTRSIGVPKLKRMQNNVITPEPFITTKVLEHHHAFLVIVSDGVTSVMSNQEIVDVVKHCLDPNSAANVIIDIADRYGTDDNATAVVLRLEGWPLNSTLSKIRDYTQNLRRYKLRQTSHGGKQTPTFDADDSVPFSEESGSLGEGQFVYEQQLDRFIIDIFDCIGKDIGSSDIGNIDKYVAQQKDPYDFRESNANKIGRITAAELKTAVQLLQVAFVNNAKTNMEVPIDEVILRIFETVGKTVDFESLPTSPPLEHRFNIVGTSHQDMDDVVPIKHTAEISQTHASTTSGVVKSALSAADILKALKTLNLKVFKMACVSDIVE
ncbi:hypothetical protein MP638_005329 [Amoeboaphelidium occidentale]|nr:hypothetical protein MP638_005329 [Amoeboaphelidium occidentale]